MTIDIENLTQLVAKADEIVFSPEGEETLLKLLELQEQIEAAIDEAKKKIEETALKANPNFSSVQGSKVKAYYRSFGTKYHADENTIDEAPKELYTVETKVTFKIDSAAVDAWIEKNGSTPKGIIPANRTKVISIQKKK
jgi:hypothetical protein